jgi:hypothetical protein
MFLSSDRHLAGPTAGLGFCIAAELLGEFAISVDQAHPDHLDEVRTLTSHELAETLPKCNAAFFCPSHRALWRVLPEVDAVTQPVVIVLATLPVIDCHMTCEQTLGEAALAAMVADDDPCERVHGSMSAIILERSAAAQ